MINLITKHKVSFLRVITGISILIFGFYAATNYISPIITPFAPYSLMITGLISFALVYGVTGIKELFSKPSDPKGNIKNFIKYFILTILLGFTTAIILQYILNLKLSVNPESGNVLSIIFQIPFMLLGEELISFYFLLVTANLIYNKFDNYKNAEIIGIIVSSILFGLLHYSTYYNGNPLTTIIHILLIQGSARIIFNISGLRSNSIVMPLLIHIIYDLVFLSIS